MLRQIEHDSILEVQLDRPPANALVPELVERLTAAIRAAGASHEAIVLSGRPGIFSAGLDVPALLELDRDGIVGLWTGFLTLLHEIAASPAPVAAAITGHSPAGGAVMALFCDLRVMADGDFRIGLNEVAVGIALPGALLAPLARLVGHRQAERLGVGGLMIDSSEAEALGFVDELAPVTEVVATALAGLRQLLALPRVSMLATRRTFRSGIVQSLEERDTLVRGLVEQWFSPPTQTALEALVDRLRRGGPPKGER